MANVDIGREIADILKTYTTEIEEGLEVAQKDVARKGAAELRNTSPVRKGPRGGRYAKGWTYKKNRGGGYVVYNKNSPQLTHLLEKGHAKVGGGRVSGIPHVRPVELQIIDDFVREVERVIRQ